MDSLTILSQHTHVQCTVTRHIHFVSTTVRQTPAFKSSDIIEPRPPNNLSGFVDCPPSPECRRLLTMAVSAFYCLS